MRRVVEVMPRILLDEILVSKPQDIAVAHGELQHQRRPICLEFCIQAGSAGLSAQGFRRVQEPVRLGGNRAKGLLPEPLAIIG